MKRARKMSATAKRRLSSNIIVLILLCCIGFLFLLPLIWMVIVAFEGQANIAAPFPPKLSIDNPSLFNLKLVTESGEIWIAYANSTIVAVCSTALSLLVSMFGGYALSKGRFKGKGFITMVIFSTMMVPFEVRMLPMFVMFNRLGLTNNLASVILPSMIDCFAMMTSKNYFDKLPNSLRESASIDGMNEFGIFFKIYLPLCGPITATLCIISFIASWNNFLWPLVVLTSPDKQTIPLFISSFGMENATIQMGTTMAVSFMSIVPILLIYVFLQKYIIQSVATTGLKG